MTLMPMHPLVGALRAALSGDSATMLRGDWDFSEGRLPATDLTPAAVLIPIILHPDPTVLLTRRTETMRRHAGQVAFPGGRIDPEDAGPVAAALREAQEEVGLDPSRVEVVGVTDTYETGTGYMITPVIGLVPPGLPLLAAEAEVAALFEVPLTHLLDAANHQIRQAEWQGRLRSFYEIHWDGHRIWGATAGMVVNLARRVGS